MRAPRKDLSGKKPHPWTGFEQQFRTVIANRKTPKANRSEDCNAAHDYVAACVLATAVALVRSRRFRNAVHLADDAAQRWWEFMLEEGGGFDQWDGVRPFHPFGYTRLKWFCLGRDNGGYDRRESPPGFDPNDDRGNPVRHATRKSITKRVRSHVTLSFDPEDDRQNPVRDATQNETAECVRRAQDDLPEKQKEVLILMYWEDANLSAFAAERGETARALHMRAFHARSALRGQLANLEWK